MYTAAVSHAKRFIYIAAEHPVKSCDSHAGGFSCKKFYIHGCRESSKKLHGKNIKMSSFKSSENIQKKEGGSDRSVSDNHSTLVTLNELAMKARKYCNFEFQQGSPGLTDINLNGVQITKIV